jgi:hypothetical protein
VIFSNNVSEINGLVDPPVAGQVDSDSSEVMTNTIGGNLICQNNTHHLRRSTPMTADSRTPSAVTRSDSAQVSDGSV